MRTTLSEILCGAAMALGLLAGVVFGIDSCNRDAGQAAQNQATEFKGEAKTHETQARAQDGRAEELQAKLDRREADLARLMAERDRLLRQRVVVQASPVPSTPDIPLPMRDNRDDIITSDALVIEAQGNQILEQKALISSLTVSRDEWKATAELREKQAMAQEQATTAWKKAVSTSKWQGRIEGALIGSALGLIIKRG